MPDLHSENGNLIQAYTAIWRYAPCFDHKGAAVIQYGGTPEQHKDAIVVLWQSVRQTVVHPTSSNGSGGVFLTVIPGAWETNQHIAIMSGINEVVDMCEVACWKRPLDHKQLMTLETAVEVDFLA